MTQMKKDELRRKQEEAAQRTLSANRERDSQLTSYALSTGTPDVDKEETKSDIDQHYKKTVLDAYKKRFKDRQPEKDDNGNDILSFNSPEEATKFFTDLAKEKKPFFVIEVDRQGNPTGNYKVSYGDGQLHEKSAKPDQIQGLYQDFLNQMKSPKPKPENTESKDRTTSINMKDRLAQMKKDNPKDQMNKDDLSQESGPTAPNPFDTTLKPKE